MENTKVPFTAIFCCGTFYRHPGDRLYFDDEIVYCKVITPGGSLGTEVNHEPLLAVSKESSTVTNPAGRNHWL
ncbi:MAG: hypothetical protein JXB88_10855 [Spirochaetales bacterium]|nr:hypothetical protein [Spirochaetales bacterium]